VDTKIFSENLKVRDHLKNLDVDGKIIIEWILQKWQKEVEWIHLVQDKE
jgi:hypothetical protein